MSVVSRLYLDHAATAPLTSAAAEAVARGMAGWANPSSPHAEGRAARAALESARNVVAQAYGWTGETIFTSGASEAIALALGRAQVAARLVGVTEHDAVLRSAPDAVRLAVGSDGVVDLAALRATLAQTPAPALVALQWANSETGVLQPLGEIAALVAEAGGKLFVDAAQMPAKWSGGVRPQDVADLIAVSAHKRGGPPGIGALLVRDLGLLLPTGGQERGYRGGTENVPAALGFAAAVAVAEDVVATAALRTRLDGAIAALGGEVVAAASPRAPHIASYRLPGLAAAAQLIRFDLAGIAVSAGSACSSGSLRPSHVLAHMGWDGARAGEVIRVSFGRTTTPADVERFISAWAGIARGCARARNRAGARGVTYLDYQATTPLAPEALAAMLPWLEAQHANPHSAHAPGRAARAAIEVARAQVAALLPADHSLAFTSGATEALNWAIKGVPGGIVTFASEHAAVLDTVAATARDHMIVPVGPDGLIDLDRARAAIVPGTGLVVAMLVNNEIGVVQPIAALADLAHAAGALLLCDAVQGYGRVPIPPGCDMIALSAHKIHGPKGIGALSIADGLSLIPLLHGGAQEAAGRSGTLSPALCAGFGAAAAVMAARVDLDANHVATLFARAVDRLGPDWQVNGSVDRRYRGNLNVRFDGLDVARLMSELRDIAFSAGSACASGSGRPSHVLRAIGLSDAGARSSIRLGFGRYTTDTELLDAIDRIDVAARRQRFAA